MPAYKDAKRGTWYVKYSYTDRITGKRKQILKRGFPTKREATAWEAKQRSTETSATSITFRALAQKYYEYRKPRAKTVADQTSMLENHFPYLDMEVEKITKQRMMDWYVDLTQKDLKPGTINLTLTVVKSICAFGEEFYNLPDNSSSLKRMRQTRRKYATWSVEEFNRFLEAEPSPLYRSAFSFLYWSGVRRGELLGLQVQDIRNGTAHIHQQATATGLAPLKTEASERTIKLTDPAQAALKPLIEAAESGQVFLFGGAKPLSAAILQTHFAKAIERSGVQKIRIHDLRHSFATNAINSGVDIVAVSKYLGHSTITITLNTYTHLLEKADEEMLQIMNNLSKSA